MGSFESSSSLVYTVDICTAGRCSHTDGDGEGQTDTQKQTDGQILLCYYHTTDTHTHTHLCCCELFACFHSSFSLSVSRVWLLSCLLFFQRPQQTAFSRTHSSPVSPVSTLTSFPSPRSFHPVVARPTNKQINTNKILNRNTNT